MIREPEKKLPTPIISPNTGLDVKKNVFIPITYVPNLSEEVRGNFWHTSVQVIFKGCYLPQIYPYAPLG